MRVLWKNFFCNRLPGAVILFHCWSGFSILFGFVKGVDLARHFQEGLRTTNASAPIPLELIGGLVAATLVAAFYYILLPTIAWGIDRSHYWDRFKNIELVLKPDYRANRHRGTRICTTGFGHGISGKGEPIRLFPPRVLATHHTKIADHIGVVIGKYGFVLYETGKNNPEGQTFCFQKQEQKKV